jgi:UDP-glucose 4-epimerase
MRICLMHAFLSDGYPVRILVTGGAGFIGSTLVDRLLAEGHSVDVIDDLSRGSLSNLAGARSLGAGFSFQQMDVRVPELIEFVAVRRPEVVFHLASQTSVATSLNRPVFDADSNIIGSLRVFEAALGARCSKVIVPTSASSLYGEGNDQNLPFVEETSYTASSPNAVAQSAIIDYLKVYRQHFNLDYTVLCLANVYGPRQLPNDEEGVVANFAAELAAGRAPTIYGDGRQTKDFVFVDDVVDSFVRSMTRGSALIYNIGTGIETSIRELYLSVATVTGTKIKPLREPTHPNELRRTAVDFQRAKRDLGWSAWTSLIEGIEATVNGLGSQ